MGPCGISLRLKTIGRPSGALIRMHPHSREVMAEARLEVPPRLFIENFAG